jgi:xeroderma pigmentosum group C-complementing protein
MLVTASDRPQARLLSLTPLELQNAFSVIHKSRVPDQNQRGRLFEAAINRLTDWWTHSFFQVDSFGHIRNATFDDIQAQIFGLESDELLRAIQDDEDEVIRSSKSLMKHALMQAGSRDASAQLFTALCRALCIPARLVVSLQSVPWQAGIGKSKPIATRKWAVGNGKGKEKMVEDETSCEGDAGQASVRSFPSHGMRLDGGTPPANGKSKAEPVITLRKARSKGHKLSSSIPRSQRPSDPYTTPPVFWTEVFSRPDARWFPVDPIRNMVNKRKVFDPSSSATAGSPSSNSPLQDNRMVYVIAFEEDGYARDVTPRYAIEYGAKVAKAQVAGGKVGGSGKSRKQWWEDVTTIVRRPYRLVRIFPLDSLRSRILIDCSFETTWRTASCKRINSGKGCLPQWPASKTTLCECRFLAITERLTTDRFTRYVLDRHLRRDEVIHPLTELGKFRGEPVYPRSNVIALKTSETWMRTCGRIIKPGCQPMKWVKMRPVTLGRKRELELAVEARMEARKEDNDQRPEAMQGMYAENQTELFIPEPIVDVSHSCLRLVFFFYSLCTTDTKFEHRVKFLKTVSETSIYLYPQCFPGEPYMFLVGSLDDVPGLTTHTMSL